MNTRIIIMKGSNHISVLRVHELQLLLILHKFFQQKGRNPITREEKRSKLLNSSRQKNIVCNNNKNKEGNYRESADNGYLTYCYTYYQNFHAFCKIISFKKF